MTAPIPFLGKVESMDADLERLRRLLDLAPAELERINRSELTDGIEALTSESKTLLPVSYQTDCDLLGYEIEA